MDLTSFLKVLLKRKWLIIFISILSAVATFFIAMQTSQVYLSKAQLATGITESNVPSDKESILNPMEAMGKFSNLIEVITSKQVITLLSYRLILHDLKEPYPFKKLEDFRKKFLPDEIEKAKVQIQNKLDSIQLFHNSEEKEKVYLEMIKEMGYDQKSLEKKLEIWRVENTDYIEIRYKSKDPYLSAFVVNTLCQEIIRYYNNMTGRRMENSVKFFSDMAAQKKADLDAKLDSLNKYKSSNKVINFEDERKSKMNQIAQLENSREEESKKIMGLQQALSSLKGRLTEGESEDYSTQYSNNKLLNLKNRINSLQERYINSGNRDKRAYDSIQILKEELEVQISRFGNSVDIKTSNSKQELKSKKTDLEIELEVAKSNLTSIDNTLYGLRSNLSGFASNESSISAMEMAISVAKDEYLHVLDKFNAAKNFSLSSGNLHQIEYGEPADEPEPSMVALLTALSAVVSFSMCVFVLLVLEYVDATIKRPSHFNDLTHVPLIGSVNQLKSSKIDFEKLFTQTTNSVVLETHKQLLRKLRYELETSNAKTFVFTSTKPGEGKTFSIISLSYSLALSGKKVLLVDTNFKNNTLSKLFAAKAGIKSFYKKNVDPEFMSSANAINATRVDGINIIGCEPNNFSPFEVLDEEKLQAFLSDASHEYDYIFLEGAALNVYADTKELVTFADKVIAIFSAKSQIKKSDQASIQFLVSLDKKFTGAILNKVDMENLDQ